MNILVVEDSEDTAQLIKAYLTDQNLNVVRTIKEARNALRSGDYQLTILDIELPDGSGFDFCNEITQDQNFLEMSVIMLTAKQTTEEKIAGLYCGADDYMTKPFSGQELRARVDACLRRHKKSSQRLMYKYGFHLDIEHQKAFRSVKNETNGNRENQDLHLTPTEFRIFMTLIKNPGKAHSRQKLMKDIWSSGLNIEKRGIDTHVSHLRKKLGHESKRIVSVYGKGYSFNIESLKPKRNFKNAPHKNKEDLNLKSSFLTKENLKNSEKPPHEDQSNSSSPSLEEPKSDEKKEETLKAI